MHAGEAMRLQGVADADFIERAKARAEHVVGLVALDTSLVRAHGDPTAALHAEWQRLVAELPGLRVHFVRELDPRDMTELQSMATNVQHLATLAAQLRELRAAALPRPQRRTRFRDDERRGLRTRRAAMRSAGRLREAGVRGVAPARGRRHRVESAYHRCARCGLEFDTAALEDE